MPDLKQLRVLRAVAEAGSFSAGAERPNYTQPAVSRTVAALEREVGGGFVGGGRPGVRVSIVEGGMTSSLVRRLRRGDLDVAVVFDYPAAGEDIGAELELHHLLDVPWDVVLPRDSRLARKVRVRAADLANESWVLPDFGPESPSLRLIGRMCAAAGFEPRVVFKVNDCHMNQALVAAGEGITILPRLLLDPLHPGVAARPLAGDTLTMRVSAVRLPMRYFAPVTAEFLVVLKDAATQWAESWKSPRQRGPKANAQMSGSPSSEP